MIVGGQRRNGHGVHIVQAAAGEAPAAAGVLILQQVVDDGLPAVLLALLPFLQGGDLKILGIQSDQGPDRAVEALDADLGEIAQGLDQVIAAHIVGVYVQSAQAEDHTGILRVLCLAEHAFLFVQDAHEVRKIGALGAVGKHPVSGQDQGCPFAALGAHHQIAGHILQICQNIVQRLRYIHRNFGNAHEHGLCIRVLVPAFRQIADAGEDRFLFGKITGSGENTAFFRGIRGADEEAL